MCCWNTEKLSIKVLSRSEQKLGNFIKAVLQKILPLKVFEKKCLKYSSIEPIVHRYTQTNIGSSLNLLCIIVRVGGTFPPNL